MNISSFRNPRPQRTRTREPCPRAQRIRYAHRTCGLTVNHESQSERWQRWPSRFNDSSAQHADWGERGSLDAGTSKQRAQRLADDISVNPVLWVRHRSH
eukprot:2205643-Rhodomonas_salina.3